MRIIWSQLMVTLLCLCLQGEAVAQSATTKKFQGFLGTYHPFKGTAFGGDGWTEGELMQRAFNFGENAIISEASYYGYTFAENIENNCREWNVNKLYGILRPPWEKGVVNQPKDSVLLAPYQKEPGMIQGARRFSEISKRCPQLAGVIIDDFFNDYPKALTSENIIDIKAALTGKIVDENGRVDHSSAAATPDLKLYIVIYEHHLNRAIDETVLNAIDGLNFWTWKQTENHERFDANIETLQKKYPNREIIAGVYVFNGAQTPTPASIHHIIERSIDYYDKGRINGLLIFSAVWMSRERSKRERWNEISLPQLLGRVYYPFLGEGRGRVVDAKTKKPIGNALVSVRRIVGGKPLLTARKFTDEHGEYSFGGWAGRKKAERVKYQVTIQAASYKPRVMNVNLHPGESLRFPDALLK